MSMDRRKFLKTAVAAGGVALHLLFPHPHLLRAIWKSLWWLLGVGTSLD